MISDRLADAVSFILDIFIPIHLGFNAPKEQFVEAYGDEGYQVATNIWKILDLEAQPELMTLAQKIALTPDETVSGELKSGITKLLAEDENRARQIQHLIVNSRFKILLPTLAWTAEGKELPTRKHLELMTLRTLRKNYSLIIFGLIALRFIVRAIVGDGQSVLIGIAAFISLPVRGIITRIYAEKIGVQHGQRWLGLTSMFAPISTWAGLTSYYPPHLTKQARSGGNVPDRGELSPLLRILALVFIAIPIMGFSILTIFYGRYIRQLFEEPLGWIIFIVMILIYMVIIVTLWGVWKKWFAEGIEISLIAMMMTYLYPTLIWLILMGPAAVQLYRAFFK